MSDSHNGWIKLYRSLQNKAYYKKDSEKVHLWIHIMIKANHSKIHEEMLGGKPYLCAPGQFTTGRHQLSLETGISESKIERILSYFEKIEQQIKQQKTNRNRLITILNWNRHQQCEQQCEQQVNNNRTTSEQQVNTLQEYKERKKVKKERRKDILSGKPDEKGVKNNNIDYVWFKNTWNEMTKGTTLSLCSDLSTERRLKIKTRCRNKNNFKELFQSAIEKIPSVPFLLGKNKNNWRVDFDFLLANGNNILKILEGKYDSKIETEEERNRRILDEEAERFYRKHPEKAKEDGYKLDEL